LLLQPHGYPTEFPLRIYIGILIVAGANSSLLPPPPVFRGAHPLAWKPRGGMIIISKHDPARRDV